MMVYILSILICLALTYSFTRLFKFLEFVDKPDGKRKIHKGEIALSGGVSIFFSISLLALLFPDQYFLNFGNKNFLFIWMLSPIILIMGLVDDIKPLTPFIRLTVQIFASWLVILTTDIYLRDFGNLFGLSDIYIGNLGIPVTIFMIVGICNAFNMMDGMDGFVGFIVLISSCALGIIGLEKYYFLTTMVPICLITFLIFNLGLLGKKVKIFLGDSGAMWIGFVLGWMLVLLSQGEERLIQPVTALWLVLLPLIDALSTFMSRLMNNKSLFLGDRSHFHHLLLDAGVAKWKVLIILIGISLAASSYAIFCWRFEIEEHYQFYAFLTIWVFYALFIKYPFLKSQE
jgi:UDP-GlcNAc:undecaprenyl-phosphate GlcNAc-1-phosphate transferase